jgi:ribosomal protein L11 methyltransferase
VTRPDWPALEIRLEAVPDDTTDRIGLVLAVLDDFAPSALDEPDAGAGFRAYFLDETIRNRAAVAIQQRLGHRGISAVPISIPDEGWAERSQALLTPVRVGRIVVTPPWHLHPADSATVAVIINPSMGFGTGHHETTRLCLAALQDLDLEGRRVLDIGTGSGVLAIAAVALGARRAMGVDADPDAVRAATENVSLNGMGERVTIAQMDFRTQAFAEHADVVTANLTGAMLARSAHTLTNCTADRGAIIVCGFTRGERDSVLRAFASAASCARESAEGEWAAAVLKKRE